MLLEISVFQDGGGEVPLTANQVTGMSHRHR